jgi:hypothetical protein
MHHIYTLYAFVLSQVRRIHLCNQEGFRVRVPAIVFDYPRHSGATDEVMTEGSSIFAYLVFGPGGVPIERITRPMKIAVWHGPGAILGVQAKIQRVQVGLVFD